MVMLSTIVGTGGQRGTSIRNSRMFRDCLNQVEMRKRLHRVSQKVNVEVAHNDRVQQPGRLKIRKVVAHGR